MATPGGATSTPSSPSNMRTAVLKTRIFSAALSMTSSSGPETARTIRRCAGASNRTRPARLSGSGGILRRGRDRLCRLSLHIRKGRRPLAGNRHHLFVRDRPERRLQRRRHDAHAGDAARAFAGDEGARRPRHRLGTARDLSRRRRRAARPCRLDHARFGRQAARGHLVCRHPRLHARSAIRRRVRSSSTCSTRCSRSSPPRFACAAARCSNSSATPCSPSSRSKSADRAETCRRALDAAIEAMRNIDAMNKARAEAGRPGRLRRSRPPSRRGALRQCRRDRPARLHRHRPGRQRSRAHRGAMRAARPLGSRLGRIRRRDRWAARAASSRSAATRCAA